MIAPGAAIALQKVLENLDYFTGITKDVSLERLMGLTDGMQDASYFGRFSLVNDNTLFIPMKREIEKRTGKVENINLTNYFGAYANGYLRRARITQKLLDMTGKEKCKYSQAMRHLEIPFWKDGMRFRTKDNVYGVLDKEGLLVYDDREKYRENGERKSFEPRFRLEIK